MTKPLQDWSFDEFKAWLASGAAEDRFTEFKQKDALNWKDDDHKKQFAKFVSAFANSAGGKIVYGVRQIGNHSFEPDDGFAPDDLNLDHLDQVVGGQIRPRIDDVRFYSITNPATRRFYPIVEIPESTTAHQNASDKKYYKRFDKRIEPMEDHEIRAAMNRAKYPIVTPRFISSRASNNSEKNEARYNIGLELHNSGPIRARDYKIEFSFPRRFFLDRNSYPELTARSTPARMEFVLSRVNAPLFPQDRWAFEWVLSFKMNDALFARRHELEPYILWKVFADDAPPRDGVVPFEKWCDF